MATLEGSSPGSSSGSSGSTGQTSGPRPRRAAWKLADMFAPAAPCKSVADLYADAPHERALKNRSFTEVHQEYPMMCFCAADGARRPCRFSRDGHDGRVPMLTKLLWSWPVFGWFALKYLKTGWMKKFYIDDYPRASLGAIAFSSVLGVLADAFVDPLMAAWSDRMKSRWGRRRPFIVASAIFAPAIFILGWTPNIVGPGLPSSLWYAFFHVGFKLTDTIFVTPHDAWGAQLTPIYKEKTSIWQWKAILRMLGALCGMAVAPLIFVKEQCTSTPDDGCLQLPLIAVFFGVIFFEGCLQLAYFGKEPEVVVEVPSAQATPQAKYKFSSDDTVPSIFVTFLNQPFRVLLITDVVKALGYEMPLSLLPFMSTSILGEKCMEASKVFGIQIIVGLVGGIISVPLWTKLTARINKYRAYVVYHVAQILACFAVSWLDYDDGSCGYTYASIAMFALFGAAAGGSFLLNDLISDAVDYDELLSGGLRREASYMMSVDLVPKFVQIPSECICFLFLAYFSYTRPLTQEFRPACGLGLQANPDEFCHAFYMNESLGEGLCSDQSPCKDLFNNGVQFVCNYALNECGHRQNEGVRWTLRTCAAMFPCICVFAGTFALLLYPKDARNESVHEELILAISRLRAGEVVEDPWRRGSHVYPPRAIPGEVAGALAYLLPFDLRWVAERPPLEGGIADLSRVYCRTWAETLVSAAVFPLGCWLVGTGFEDMSDDLGASVSPLGLMVLGLSILGLWLGVARLLAVRELRRRRVEVRYVVEKYNQLCPYLGKPPLPGGAWS